MTENNCDYEIPQLEPKLFFGLSTDIIGNAHYISDTELLHPAGKILVLDNHLTGEQNFIKIQQSRKKLSIVGVSPNRKYVVVGEECDKPTLSVYDVASRQRLKLLGIPIKGSCAKGWASIAFLQDNEHLIAISGKPEWKFLIYNWRRGKVLVIADASQHGQPVNQVIPNMEDGTMLALIGPGLFRLMSQSDNVWRQYGFSRAENLPFECGAWIGPQQLLTGTRDGRLLLIEYGELRAVYMANKLNEINLSHSVTKTSDTVTLASQTVPDENKSGLHEVRALTSFEKGFLFSCNVGEIFVFEKIDKIRWIKKSIIRIQSSLPDNEYRKFYKINYCSVNPSNDRVVCTTRKTELYISQLFWTSDERKNIETMEFELDGSGYHDGPIVAVSSCLWKPIFMTAGAEDKTIRLWDYENLKVIIIKKFSDEIYSAALHPSGFFCLLGFTDKLRFMLILVNDLATVRHVDIRSCRNVAFAAGGHLFAATRDNDIEVYSAIYFTCLHVLHGHLGPVTRLVYGLRDRRLWSCGGEGSLYEWDLETGERLTDIFTNKNGQLGLAISDAVYTVGTDGKLKEIIKGEVSREIDMLQGSLNCVTLGNGGQMLFLGGEKSSVLSVLYPLVHPPKWNEFSMHSQPIVDIVITHEDATLMTTSDDGFLCVWRIICGEEKKLDLNKGFIHVKELLLSFEDLENMTLGIKELKDRLRETEGEHEYAMRQIAASNETALIETNANYTSIIEDLKFRIKQMEREHLVEINKYQTLLNEEKGSHSVTMENLEKRYNEKLISELKRIEELECINEKQRKENERMALKMEKQVMESLDQFTMEKQSIIQCKNKEIEELHDILSKIEDEKKNMKVSLEEEFNLMKKDIGKSFESTIQDKNKTIQEISDENGILIKTSLIMKKEINSLKETIQNLTDELNANTLKLSYSLEETNIIKTQLEESEIVIANKDKLIVKLTRQNDVYKKELLFRDTTVECLLQKVAPKDLEIQMKNLSIEQKNVEIDEMKKLLAKSNSEIKYLQKKIHITQKQNRRYKITFAQIKSYMHKINLVMRAASSSVYQLQILKQTIIEMSDQFLSKYKHDIKDDAVTFNEMIDRLIKMEKIIEKLQNSLHKQKGNIRVIDRPHEVIFEMLTEFTAMASDQRENKKTIQYLKKLLKLKTNKYNEKQSNYKI